MATTIIIVTPAIHHDIHISLLPFSTSVREIMGIGAPRDALFNICAFCDQPLGVYMAGKHIFHHWLADSLHMELVC